ncbi:MAG: ATP-binding cassette permease mdl1 [Chaenotheca gracillima]|nr:MAG: ATP-binding cassette permease mdl1 [Chaenotheca gracillima]
MADSTSGTSHHHEAPPAQKPSTPASSDPPAQQESAPNPPRETVHGSWKPKSRKCKREMRASNPWHKHKSSVAKQRPLSMGRQMAKQEHESFETIDGNWDKLLVVHTRSAQGCEWFPESIDPEPPSDSDSAEEVLVTVQECGELLPK